MKVAKYLTFDARMWYYRTCFTLKIEPNLFEERKMDDELVEYLLRFLAILVWLFVFLGLTGLFFAHVLPAWLFLVLCYFSGALFGSLLGSI